MAQISYQLPITNNLFTNDILDLSTLSEMYPNGKKIRSFKRNSNNEELKLSHRNFNFLWNFHISIKLAQPL